MSPGTRKRVTPHLKQGKIDEHPNSSYNPIWDSFVTRLRLVRYSASNQKCNRRASNQKCNRSVQNRPTNPFETHSWRVWDSFVTHSWPIRDSFVTHSWLTSESSCRLNHDSFVTLWDSFVTHSKLARESFVIDSRVIRDSFVTNLWFICYSFENWQLIIGLFCVQWIYI